MSPALGAQAPPSSSSSPPAAASAAAAAPPPAAISSRRSSSGRSWPRRASRRLRRCWDRSSRTFWRWWISHLRTTRCGVVIR